MCKVNTGVEVGATDAADAAEDAAEASDTDATDAAETADASEAADATDASEIADDGIFACICATDDAMLLETGRYIQNEIKGSRETSLFLIM